MNTSSLMRRVPPAPLVASALVVVSLMAAGCGRSTSGSAVRSGLIVAVGAENEYANVIKQIGGRYVSVAAIMSNPNADPHSFEASPSVAETIGGAKLIVQNGVGYDTFMNKIESASPSSSRTVIDVQKLAGLPDSARNPHLWYDPKIVSEVGTAVAHELAKIEPRHARYFSANAERFSRSLQPVFGAMRRFRARYGGVPVATTEPVADYLVQAAGAKNMTPWNLQADIMNGVDPAPQDVSLQDDLFKQHRVKAFLYNEQVTDTITQSFLKLAARYHVPVVAVYETMPRGYRYQTWMAAELAALRRAVAGGRSTRSLR